MQYGDYDVSGPTYCRGFVKDEPCRILVDTGSSVTIISSDFFDRVKDKISELINYTTKVRYMIQGVTGDKGSLIADVQKVPLRFDKLGEDWNVNAGIMKEAPADIILGVNFLTKYEAELDLRRKRLVLRKEGSSTTVQMTTDNLFRHRPVYVIEPMEIDNPIRNLNWRCEKGPQEYRCLKGYPDDAIIYPCNRCKDRARESDDFAAAKTKFNGEKYTAHSNTLSSCGNGTGNDDNVTTAYELYPKGARLTPCGQVIVNGIAIGEVGDSWTEYHPEWRVKKPKPKDRNYERRTKEWKKLFVDPPERTAEINAGLEQAKAEKKRRLENTFEIEVPYVLHHHKKRKVTCQIKG